MRSPQRLRPGAHAAPRRGREHGSPRKRRGRHCAPGTAAWGGRIAGTPLRLAAVTAMAGAAVGMAMVGQPANAQSGSSIEFSGSCGVAGLGLLGGDASSNPGQLSVPRGAEVAFTNRFDRPATLHVDGDPTALVGPGDAAEVAFEHGPATVTMQIDCPIGAQVASATVGVVGDDAPASQVAPGPATGSAPPAGSSAPPSAPAAGSPGQSDPDSDAGSARGAGSPGSAQPGSAQPGSGPDPGGWQAFVAPDPPDQGEPGGAGPEQPDRDQAPDRGDELGARWRDQVETGAPSGNPDTVDEQATDDVVVTDRVASTADSPAGGGPIGLLALVATICVVGVSAGAVRTIITQRAASGAA